MVKPRFYFISPGALEISSETVLCHLAEPVMLCQSAGVFPVLTGVGDLMLSPCTSCHRGAFNVRDKNHCCQELLERMKMSIWGSGSASAGGESPRFDLQELK